MKKFSTKIIAALLSFVLMFTGVFALVISANEYNFKYTDISPTILTPDTFSELFSDVKIDKVSYDYDVIMLDTIPYVMLIFEVNTTLGSYIGVAEGIVDMYELPSGRSLLEGAIDGELTINNSTHDITVAFTKIVGEEDAMISVTLEEINYSTIAFSFGENLLTGEILDLFIQKSKNFNNEDFMVENGDSLLIYSNLNSQEIISPNVIRDPSIGIFDPGGSDPHLGENFQYRYQYKTSSKWESTDYRGVESGVYFDQSRNLLMITLRPFVSETEEYIEEKYVTNGGYDFSGVSLDSFGVELTLYDVPAANYAYIAAFDRPSQTNNIQNYFNQNTTVDLNPLFEDILSLIGIPTSTIMSIFEGMSGKISTSPDGSRLNAYVDITLSSIQTGHPEDLENIYTGLPLQFQLAKGNQSTYQGNTPYTVNTYAKYFVFVQVNPFLSEPQYNYFYISKTFNYDGEIDLG